MLRRVLPRAGYAAMGLVYAIVGVVAARIAFLGARDRVAGVHGALRLILRQTEGRWILATVAAGLACFSVWRLFQTFSARGNAITRAGWAITAIGYGALAWTAVGLILKLPSGESFERIGVGRLLPHPAGRLALLLAALILVAVGIVAVAQGLSGRLPQWLAGLAPRRTPSFASRVARLGLTARGIVSGVMGYMLFRAIEDFDPREAREIGGSLSLLSKTPGGPIAMGIVAVGLVLYGFAMWAVAASRRPV